MGISGRRFQTIHFLHPNHSWGPLLQEWSTTEIQRWEFGSGSLRPEQCQFVFRSFKGKAPIGIVTHNLRNQSIFCYHQTRGHEIIWERKSKQICKNVKLGSAVWVWFGAGHIFILSTAFKALLSIIWQSLWECRDSNPWWLGEKCESYLCAIPSPTVCLIKIFQ